MRKILLFIAVIAFASCSKSGGGDFETEIPKKVSKFKLENINLEGVWESTSYPIRIISFSDDKLFSGLLDDNTIDDGDYSINGDTIIVKNTYHGYDIKFELVSARNDALFFNIWYLGSSEYGYMKEKKVSVEFRKTTDDPCARHNRLVGKNIEVNTSHDNVVWEWDLSVIQHDFMTFALKLNQSSKVTHTGTVHYFYYPPTLYFTLYKDGDIWLTNIFTPVNKRFVEIDSNGRISIKRESR